MNDHLKTSRRSQVQAVAGLDEAHLTDDQLDELLIESEARAAQADGLQGRMRVHLSVCPYCRERLDEVCAPLAVFNAASLHWSEARSNTVSCDLSAELTRRRAVALPMTWLAPITAVLLFAVALTLSPTRLDSLFWIRDRSGDQTRDQTRDQSAGRTAAMAATPAGTQAAAASLPGRPDAAAGKRAPLLLEAAAMMPALAHADAASAGVHPSHDRRELAEDNAMMLAIDSAIDPQEPAPDEFARTVGGGSGPLNKIAASQVSD